MKDIKPDGWCAWHPAKGFNPKIDYKENYNGITLTGGGYVKSFNIIEHEKWVKLSEWVKEFRSTGIYNIYTQEELIKQLDAIMGEK